MYKMAIVMRSDLEMGKGKLAAQASHAVLETYLSAAKKRPTDTVGWLAEGQKKVVLKVDSKEELLQLYEQLRRLLPAELIIDAGRTQLEQGTITCFAVGPAPEPEIDKWLSKLKLL